MSALVIAIASLVVTLYVARLVRAHRTELRLVRADIAKLARAVDGRMDELVAQTQEVARLAGVGSERQIGADRAAAVAVETARAMEKRTAVQVVAEIRALQTDRGQTAGDAANESGGHDA